MKPSRLAPAVALLILAACAAAPPAGEYLDMRTGATIYRVADPLLLYRRITSFGESDAEFVQLAPFEINRAGDYRLYLWVELPGVEHDGALDLDVDGTRITMPLVTVDRRSIGMGDHVYERHAGWGKSGFYRLREDQLVVLANAASIRYESPSADVIYELAGSQADVRHSFLRLRELTD